jgi:thymidylate synthase (FAD)
MEKGWQQKVLDKGYVRYVDHMGSDAFVVECARMSTGGGFVSWDPYQKCSKCALVHIEGGPLALIGGCDHVWVKYPDGDFGMLRHMMRENHTSPYEFGELVVEIKGPLMVFREHHRHRTQSYSEASARYAPMTQDCYVPDLGRIKKQSKTNKQASGEAFLEEDAEIIVDMIETEQEEIDQHYRYMLDRGVAREIARINCPVARYSTMRAKANLLNWLKFLKLRLASNAQWEIQEYARQIEVIVRAHWPRVYELFEEFDLYSTRFSRGEMTLLRRLKIQPDSFVGSENSAAVEALIKKVLGS